MPTTRLADPDDPRLAVYATVRDPDLVRREHRFLAEGRLLVRALLASRTHVVESVLVTPIARAGLADALDARGDVEVLEIEPQLLEHLGGIRFHQGCLAAARRPQPKTVAALLAVVEGPGPLLVLENVSNPDNIGTLLRSALALGAAGAVLSPTCASPLYRKALRASMGAALRLPFAHDAESWEASLVALQTAGVVRIGFTPAATAEPLPAWARARDRGRRVALFLGAEHDGLQARTMAALDVLVRIPMAAGVDSLNVAAAGAIGLYELARE
ncbi:MAG: TrmH family RNA methyltransferase [Planctomycetota bacterium]